MTFRARIHRTDPQNTGGQFGTLSDFLRNTQFERERAKKAPISGLFQKRTPADSLIAPLSGLAKSILC